MRTSPRLLTLQARNVFGGINVEEKPAIGRHENTLRMPGEATPERFHAVIAPLLQTLQNPRGDNDAMPLPASGNEWKRKICIRCPLSSHQAVDVISGEICKVARK